MFLIIIYKCSPILFSTVYSLYKKCRFANFSAISVGTGYSQTVSRSQAIDGKKLHIRFLRTTDPELLVSLYFDVTSRFEISEEKDG